MAQRVTVEFIDDIDGSEATETVTFALDGIEYEIDLSDDNAAKLRHALSPYIEAGRRAGGRKRRNQRPNLAVAGEVSATASYAERQARREELRKVREWAKENGYDVPSRGRVPQDIQDAYATAVGQ